MRKKLPGSTYWLIGFLMILSVIVLVKGCKKERRDMSPAQPAGNRQPEFHLKLNRGTNLQAKVNGITITGKAVDNIGNPLTETINPVSISNPSFPLNISLEFYVPPCRYQLTVIASQTSGPSQISRIIVDACQQTAVDMYMDTFDDMLIPSDVDPIHAPGSANAGQTIVVSCGPAPVSDQVTATLSEQGGSSVSGSVDSVQAISGTFSDPFALTSSENRRLFTCRIVDSQARSQSFTRAVRRDISGQTPIPTPTGPTPTPSPTLVPGVPTPTLVPGVPTPTLVPGVPTPTLVPGAPTPTPPDVPTPTPIPTPTPTPTPTATPTQSGSSKVIFSEEFRPVTITAEEIELIFPSGTLRNVKGSGVDVHVSSINRVSTVIFSEPVFFASAKFRKNSDHATLKALDTFNNLVDVDVGSSECNVFGKDIVKLELVGIHVKITEFGFIPQP